MLIGIIKLYLQQTQSKLRVRKSSKDVHALSTDTSKNWRKYMYLQAKLGAVFHQAFQTTVIKQELCIYAVCTHNSHLSTENDTVDVDINNK